MLPNAKYLDEVYPLVEADFAKMKENADKVAVSDEFVEGDVVTRVKYALKMLDKEKVDKIAKKYLLPH